MPEATTTPWAGWEVLSEVARIEPALWGLANQDELHRPGDPGLHRAMAVLAERNESVLGEAYSATRSGFDGEDYIVGYSRGLYTAIAVLCRAMPLMEAEELENARASIAWLCMIVHDLAEKASELSAAQREGGDDV